ncbi:hypothetical protein COT97_03970 [Candidatus Falkowbacteria bacterium CG10_big_fil_rev_8_21_14_0_10_39_11]|uniref:phosphoglycerate mutase (2,3-diphosphoglycerate-dependent) n=1 Tax=Candidatus Falkowbacteria bacterium CG10_big_fil_rev_8_21_14_0_10_39_11 TaxID=1974565 RepID=A0A2H0V4D5_9BACT|nr:MAG: hypothetical protein COT97_03970 [Candidatus Falkowbacteria bacterium CG10_big_fil_rev_8_21_14_0_10_39_11]
MIHRIQRIIPIEVTDYLRNLIQTFLFPWPEALVLVRHAESLANYETDLIRDGVITGYTGKVKDKRDMDVELTERGHEQAIMTGIWLRERFPEFDKYFRSPYIRTCQTSEHLYPHAHWRNDARLREKDFGVVDQLTDEEVAARYPDLVEYKKKIKKFYLRPPGGENYPDMAFDRGHNFLGMLKRDYPRRTVVVVSHSALLMCIRFLLEKMDEETLLEKQKTEPIENASVIIYRQQVIKGKSRLIPDCPPVAPWKQYLK